MDEEEEEEVEVDGGRGRCEEARESQCRMTADPSSPAAFSPSLCPLLDLFLEEVPARVIGDDNDRDLPARDAATALLLAVALETAAPLGRESATAASPADCSAAVADDRSCRSAAASLAAMAELSSCAARAVAAAATASFASSAIPRRAREWSPGLAEKQLAAAAGVEEAEGVGEEAALCMS